MANKRRKLFCEYNQAFYKISVLKENLRRDFLNMSSKLDFAREMDTTAFPHIAKGHCSFLLRELLGVDMCYQYNKVRNLELAAKTMNGLVIHPGQTFSFWKCIGKPTSARGYLLGLTLSGKKFGYDIGGGICQLANMVFWLVLHSPLQVTERHHHTDCLFPDVQRRVPFGTGTSVFYKNVDFQFKNITHQDVQLNIWLNETHLCGELRTKEPFPLLYRLEEDAHHFAYQGEKLYRNSKIYRLIYDRATLQLVKKELLFTNHSEVMYNYALVPQNEIISASCEENDVS